MEIIDLSDEYADTYCKCLEGWSPEMREAGDLKARWLARNRERGLRVKLARNERNEIVGMIHYAPIERAPAAGKGLYYVYCVWVHGYKKGVGNHQGRGVGTLLLEAAEKDARELGARGMAAWGLTLPFFMRSKWFKRRGYVPADRDGAMELVWKPFEKGAVPPGFLRQRKKPETAKDAVTVTCLRNGWCPAQNLACERAKRAAAEFPGRVRYVEIDTDDPERLAEWGVSDAIFVDDRMVVTGPPPKYEKLRGMLRKAVARSGR